jgi:hypothetical protein
MVEMQVRSADAGPGDADDGVVGMLYYRLGLLLGAHTVGSSEIHGKHAVLLGDLKALPVRAGTIKA